MLQMLAHLSFLHSLFCSYNNTYSNKLLKWDFLKYVCSSISSIKTHWSQSAFSVSALFVSLDRGVQDSLTLFFFCVLLLLSQWGVAFCIVSICLSICLENKYPLLLASHAKVEESFEGNPTQERNQNPDTAQSDKLNEHLGLIINHDWSPNNPWIHFHMGFTLWCCQYTSDISKRCKKLLLLCHDTVPTAL